MLVISAKFLSIFRQVLKYLEENYVSEENNCYEDKFEMISNRKPVDDEEFFSHSYIDFRKTEWDEISKLINQNKYKENMFCKNIIAYLDNDLERLKICCKKSHLTPAAYEKICDGTFSPTKPCVWNLSISAKLNFQQVTELFKSANIFYYQFNKFDVVMSFFFENEIYDLNIINTTLYILDLPMLGCYFV